MDQIINGKVYDWSSVTIDVNGLSDLQITEISYDDEIDFELIYGKGGKPRGYGTGNYKNTVKITMVREDFDRMLEVQKKAGKKFYRYDIPQITVCYADEGAPTSTDVLKNIKLSKRSFKAAQGDKSMVVSFDGTAVGGIVTNGVEAW